MSKEKDEPPRRIEVFTGSGRRRTWDDEEKARIVAESCAGDETVSGVARRHGLTAQQLFGWRRAARVAVESMRSAAPPLFVPAVMGPIDEPKLSREDRRRPTDDGSPLIGFDIAGASVRVCRDADVAMVTAIIRALKATK